MIELKHQVDLFNFNDKIPVFASSTPACKMLGFVKWKIVIAAEQPL